MIVTEGIKSAVGSTQSWVLYWSHKICREVIQTPLRVKLKTSIHRIEENYPRDQPDNLVGSLFKVHGCFTGKREYFQRGS